MQHISKLARAGVLAAALVSLPVVAFAESDGSFSGTVIDPVGLVGVGRDHRRPQRADRRGAVGRRQRRGALRRDRPAAVRSTRSTPPSGLRPARIHRHAAGGGAGVPARPDAAGRRRHRGRHGHGQRHGDGPQLGPHRRQRQRARDPEPAGQRPPDVAADAAGAGLAERRHRHLERRPLQRPRQPAERHQVRRRRGLGHHRRLAGQHRRPDRLAVQAAGEPRERAGVPRRVEQLPGRVRHRHRRPGQRHHQVGLEPGVGLAVRVLPQRQARRARTTSTRPATPTAASSRSCRSRSSTSTSSAARSAARC